MTTYKSLPPEILVIIFRHLRSVLEIAECRLVCKAWNDPAETAMFSKSLIVYHEAKAEKVIRHLERNPARGRSITSLAVTGYEDQRVMKKLLQLAFTPSIERLTGKVLDIFSSAIRLSAIYTTIIEIAENSPIKFDRLKIIPDTFVLNDLYGKALLTFKETLETVQLRLFNHDDTQDVLHRFDEFKRLKALRLEEGEFNNIKELDAVLEGCHHLKELYLNVEILDQMETPNHHHDSAVLWQRMQVGKVPSLKRLSFASPGYPLVVEYLLYKYPNILDFKLDPMAMVEPSLDNNLTSLNFERTLHSLKNLTKYSLHFTMPPGDNLGRKCTAAKGDINSLTIQYPTQFIEDNEMNLHLDVIALEKKTRKAHFILEIPKIAASFKPTNLVREVDIPLERLELDFVNCAAVDGDRLLSQQIYKSKEAAVFFNLLYEFPLIKEMKLTAHYLNKAGSMFSAHDTTELRSLEICGARVTQNALQCVSYKCPQLKELKLINCCLAPNDHQNAFHVRMDRTSFDHFIYASEPVLEVVRDKEDQYAIDYFYLIEREMQASWIQPDVYLWLGIKEIGKKIYFLIRAHSDEAPFAVCQEIFDLRPVKKAPLIHFACYSIKSLTIQLGPVSFFLNEEVIRECVESSDMSYALEKNDINPGEEDEEEEE